MNSNQIPETRDDPQPKWFGLVNDAIFYSPQSRVKARVIKAQTAIPQADALVRDFNTPNDVLIDDDDVIDLRDGNVFFSRESSRCRVGKTTGEPKLALVVDDRPELITLRRQLGKSIIDLFDLPSDVKLFRDYESPQDEPINLEDHVNFEDGPVFYTRGHICGPKEITIFVDTVPKKVRQTEITFEQVLALAYETPPIGADVHFTINFRRGPRENPDGLLVENGASVKLKEGMRFDVSANDRS